MDLTGRFNNIREGLAGRFSKGDKWQDPGASSESRQIVDMLQNKNVQSLQKDLEQAPQETQGMNSAAPQQGEGTSENGGAINPETEQTANSEVGGEGEQQESVPDNQSDGLIDDDEARDDLLSSFASEGLQHVMDEELVNSLLVLDIYQLLEDCKSVDYELRSRQQHSESE
ncbi:MAG: hypothetical protein ACLFVK_02155 [Dehalococcoidia bacterium]